MIKKFPFICYLFMSNETENLTASNYDTEVILIINNVMYNISFYKYLHAMTDILLIISRPIIKLSACRPVFPKVWSLI